MKLEIGRDEADGKTVELKVAGLPGHRKTWTTAFSHRGASEFEADLFEAALAEQLGDGMARLRQECYEAGFKDGRAKKAKTNWFSRSFDTERGVP